MKENMFCCGNIRRFFIFALILTLSALGSSCSGKLGYSVLLWSVPEKQLADGDVVPVYIKSNISRVYVIGVPGSNEKVEVPFWQILPPDSKRKIQKQYMQFSEYTKIYARVKLDGLPVRFEPVNTSRQVYRLKKDEMIKILYKGEGAQVMSGNKPMPGDWMYILTEDGTQGWCFSYNLQLIDQRESQIDTAKAVEQADPVLESLLKKVWYPEIFRSMIESKKVDLDVVKPGVAFVPLNTDGNTVFNPGSFSETYAYEGAVKIAENTYQFNNTPLTVLLRQPDYMVVQYSDARGVPKSYTFVTLQNSVEDSINAEKERRANELVRIASFSPEYRSSNYGSLKIADDGTFTWSGFQQLMPSIIPQGTVGNGTVETRYFINSVVSTWYEGVLSFKFAGRNDYVNFLYKLEPDGLRLEDVGKSAIKNNTVVNRNTSSLVLFFGTP